MIRINVHDVLARAAAEKAAPKKLPEINIGQRSTAKNEQVPPSVIHAHKEAVIDRSRNEIKSDLVKSLWIEFNAVITERNRLSTQIAHMVERDADQGELRSHYSKIESHRPALQDLYDKIKYAEKHGRLPEAPVKQNEPETIHSLKLQRESLIDKRSKLKSKIAKKKSDNPAKYAEWQLELERANVEYQALCEKIKSIEG
jgi:hypothetical protein